MPKLTIDGQQIEVEPGTTVLQACERAGIEVPRFCYHERLSIAGNCRMCLVEVKPGPPKPQASCALPCADNMEVFTQSDMAKKARLGVMEFLLINHPLDCPICDQGGECDLQDQAMAYGDGFSRYRHHKRAVPEKYMGPLIKTHMTRCIHCTRCVRFAEEVAGVPALGAVGRGEDMEISTLDTAFASELSGNVNDLCPVGALTHAPYAFIARPWELNKTESIDVMDGLGSNIRIDSRGNEVLRILPRLHEEVNEEWLSDKARYSCDGLRRRRLDVPYVRRDGTLRPASWQEAFAAIADAVKGVTGAEMAAIVGDHAPAEAMLLLKELMNGLGCEAVECRQDGAAVATGRHGAIMNSGIAGVDQADALLLVGTSPRREAPVLNARIRGRWLRGRFRVARIGTPDDLTYRVEELGEAPDLLDRLLDGGAEFRAVLDQARHPMIIVGASVLTRPDAAGILHRLHRLAEAVGAVGEEWNGFNVLQHAASRVGGLELGLTTELGLPAILDRAGRGELRFAYLLGADAVPMERLGKAFVVYHGSHGDAGARRADVILPGAAYTEQDGIFVNTEGRVQRARRAVHPPGEAREDWKILRALSDALGTSLPYAANDQIRRRLAQVNPLFQSIDERPASGWGPLGADGPLDPGPLVSPIADYYLTDPISRASQTMQACSRLYVQGVEPLTQRTGTDG